MANPPLLFAYVRSSVTPRIHHRLPYDISHRYRRHRPVTCITFIGPRLPYFLYLELSKSSIRPEIRGIRVVRTLSLVKKEMIGA